MDESRWLASNDPEEMIHFLGRTDDGGRGRILRLFACACCRRIEPLLSDDSRAELRMAELLAEGRLTESERRAARDRAFHARWVPDTIDLSTGERVDTRHVRGTAKQAVVTALTRNPLEAATFARHGTPYGAIRLALAGDSSLDRDAAFPSEQAFQADILRDLVGNPFRPPTFDPAHRTSDVIDIARAIDENRAFDRLTILADALMDAGCEDPQILGHCRGPGPHVFGCWVVGLILGKSRPAGNPSPDAD